MLAKDKNLRLFVYLRQIAFKGVLLYGAEIIPSEPDAGNAAEGIGSNRHTGRAGASWE